MKYTEKFKIECATNVIVFGYTPKEIEKELKVSSRTVQRWVNKYREQVKEDLCVPKINVWMDECEVKEKQEEIIIEPIDSVWMAAFIYLIYYIIFI